MSKKEKFRKKEKLSKIRRRQRRSNYQGIPDPLRDKAIHYSDRKFDDSNWIDDKKNGIVRKNENAKTISKLQNNPKYLEVLGKNSHTGQRNTFISFSISDEAQVQLLRSQAKNDKFELKFRDYSAKEKFGHAWKTNMKEKMKLCSRTIVFVGENTHERKAVNWEIKAAYELGHKVIGVRIYRDSNHQIPEQLKRNNTTIIDWNLGDMMEQLNTV